MTIRCERHHGDKDRLAKPGYKPRGCISAYYLWHGCLVNRCGAIRGWISALEELLAQLEERPKS